VEVAPVAEVGPMEDVRPVERVTMYEAVSAAMEDGRRTKTAVVDRHPTTSEPTAVKRGTAASESAAVKATAAAAAEATASATAETTTAAAMATMPNFGRQPVGCNFR
jgi:hypothetical protein